MIQRVQSLFLLAYSLTGFLYRFLFHVESNDFVNWSADRYAFVQEVPLVLAVAVALLIFCYNKRKLQMTMIKWVVVFHISYWVTVVYALSTVEVFPLIIAFLGLIALGLAFRFIRKDELLVQSLDRLR